MLSEDPITFIPLPYPSNSKPFLAEFQLLNGLATKGLSSRDVPNLLSLYNKNEFFIPIPTFGALFAEHAVAPFFVFQIFCVALWCLDEYQYYSILTLFMLVMFECTVVYQVSESLVL